MALTMGELAKQQRSAQGPKRSAQDSAVTGIAIPIFSAPLFDPAVHRIPNWITIPGHKPGTFDGEDALGWGVHPIGLVSCINIPMCEQFDLEVNHSFGRLWELESTAKERAIATENKQKGYRLLLKRLIVRVGIDFTSIQFIPDPEVWNIYVPLDLTPTSVQEGVMGKLVLKSGLTEKLQAARDGIMSKYRRKLGLCMK